MSQATTWIIGAGLAGLSAATALAGRGRRVELIEGAAQPGGRCRSYFDPQLGMIIDNGNHLVLSGNRAVMAYLRRIGASERLAGPDEAEIAFADLAAGVRWTVRPNAGPVPWWILDSRRNVAGARATDYLALAALLHPPQGRRIDQVMNCKGVLWDRLLDPFLLAVLNTRPEEGDAGLAAAVIRETLAKGGRACRPRIASPTLAAAFIEPAVAYVEAHGGRLRCGRRARAVVFQGDRATAIQLPDEEVSLGDEDVVVVATPPWTATELVPGTHAPDAFRAIVNAHFKLEPPKGLAPILGLIGGTAEWVFSFDDRISVTVSGADRLLDADREELARTLWSDVARAHGLSPSLPPWQIVKERRATFAATPGQAARRPGARTRWRNLFLAGDWTATGLPATIEGALRSGETAADLAGAVV